jgi:predicted component of type VI protein secretion system
VTLVYGYRASFCQIDYCELLGSGKDPENGTISRYLPVFRLFTGEPVDLRESMPLQLEIVGDHKDILGDDCVREFRENGGTIGRSLENDWILPDPNHFISGKHATIDFQAGAYYLADISSNGVFVNDEAKPLGKGNPRRLFDGDRLRMGDFEFEVTLDEGESLAMPPPEPMTVVPDHVERLVPEQILKTGINLLDEEEITGDEEFESALFGASVAKKEPTKDKGQINKQANPFATPPTTEETRQVDLENVLDAFMKGLDISRAEIHPSTDPLEVMENAGRVLKEFVDGTSELLSTRGGLKAMFRLEQTTVMSQHNNPLKLAENTRDSMMQLLIGKEGEYLSPVDAVREVCRDLKLHHGAVLEAMMSAFVEFIGRFNPDALQENFDRTLDRKPLFKGVNQLKYWQLYCDLYPIMTQQNIGTFPHQFAEDFVRAYEKHLTDAERQDRRGENKKKPALEKEPVAYDQEELVDQTEEASYEDQF